MSTSPGADAGSPAKPRPSGPRTVVDESWFGALGATGEAAALVEDSRFAASWQSEPPGGASRPARGGRSIVETTFERIYRAFIAARAAIGAALIVTLALGGAFGLRPSPALAA